MPFVGTGHIWLIGILLIIVLIVWGPGKLPEVGSGMGRAIREFRKATTETKAEFSRATAVETPVATTAAIPVGQVAAPPPIATVPAPPAMAVPVGTYPAAAYVATEDAHTAPS